MMRYKIIVHEIILLILCISYQELFCIKRILGSRWSIRTARVFSGLSKFVAGTKWENKLLGQGDAAEHQFHA